jgi:hypothetical protein
MIIKDKKKFRGEMRIVCKIIKHKWRPVNKTNLGFRIKDICIRCGKVRTVTNKELYIE